MTRYNSQASIVALALALTPTAFAEQVEVTYLGSQGNAGRAAQVSLSGGLSFNDGSTDKLVWAGTRSFLIDGQLVRAYASELTSSYGNGVFEKHNAVDLLGETKTNALNALFASHNNGNIANREQTVAFQAMIWEIVYDFDGTEQSLDITDGNVRTRLINRTMFESMTSSVMRSGPSTLDIISSDEFNNNILVVPLPSTVALSGLGLASLVSIRRRR